MAFIIKPLVTEKMTKITDKSSVEKTYKVKGEAMMSGGVMIATKIAKRCCRAANIASRNGGRSLSP